MSNNIAFLISSLQYGGAEKQAVNDANILSGTNKVFLITFKDGPQKSDVSENVTHLIIKKTGYVRTALKLRKIISQNNIKTVHSSLFASMIISVIASLFSSVSIIWHYHSHEFDLPFFAKIAFITCSRFKNVKIITFVSKELCSDLTKRFLLPRRKNAVIYNSGNVESPNEIKNNEKIIIGYVGRIVELKRVNYLPELAEYFHSNFINNFEFLIVGDGEELEKIKRNIKIKDLDKYFKFLGFKQNIEYYYSKFDVFILPSREECLSISLIDAGLAGIPSVAFDVGGNSEIIINGETGYIVRNLDELKIKSLDLLKDRNLRLEFGKRARVHCVNNFSKEIRTIKINELNKNAG